MRSIESGIRMGVKLAALPLGVASGRRQGDAVILCYHRTGAGEREIDVPGRLFVQQLETIAAEGDTQSMESCLASVSGGVVLTFDDGFRDFYDVALPHLVRLGVPCILYLATAFVNAGDLRSGIGPTQALTWSMLEEAASTGLVTVGSHTHRHVDLSGMSERESEDEMRRSKALIEDRLGQACRHFAYPWGKSSPGAERAARRIFSTAALDAWRTNRAKETDPHRLGRTPVFRSDAGFLFRAKLHGRLDGERFAYRALRKGPWAPS